MNGQNLYNYSPLYKYIRSGKIPELAKILQMNLNTFYRYVEGVRKLDIYRFKKLISATNDKDLINWILEGSDYIAVKARRLNLNGKWEDEIIELVKLLGEIIEHLEKNERMGALRKISNVFDILMQLKREIEANGV